MKTVNHIFNQSALVACIHRMGGQSALCAEIARLENASSAKRMGYEICQVVASAEKTIR